MNSSIEHNNTSSYRSIFKATSLFGGVQVYQILIRLIRSKIVAVLLGPLGIGIQGLLISALDVVKNISSLGLSQSAVRDVSAANKNNDENKIGEIITVVRSLVWITGIAGALIFVVLSPLLSKTSFGNLDYVLSFVILSITILVDQVSAGQKIVLQGLRRLKDLAKASAVGVTLGLFSAIPFYYLLGAKGIVPALLAYSFSQLLVSWYFSRRVKIVRVKLPLRAVFREGGIMIKMGIALCYSSVLVSLCSYIVRGFISHIDGPEMVGLYTAGVSIASTYVGLIFTAMNADFYPRLAAVNNDNEECRKIVSQQGEIGALILGPLVLACIVFMPYIIRLLFSDEFLLSCDYVILAITGMLFRLASWLISIQFIAKGEARIFAINETASNLYCLVLNILGYRYFGLMGIGASFILGYIIYFIQVYIIASKKYSFRFSPVFIRIFIIQVIFSVIGIWVSFSIYNAARYIIGGLLFLFLFGYSIVELNKRTGIFDKIKTMFYAKK